MTGPVEMSAAAALLDMDGVLVDSTATADRAWRRWAAQRRLDPAHVLRYAHGRRTADTVRLAAPHLDADAEAAAIEGEEASDTAGLEAIPGAVDLVATLPPGRWAVVTSASRLLAQARLRAIGLPEPRVLVAAEDVSRGKPDPACYLEAARRLGAAPVDCVVVEDAPAGVAAGKAAGMRVVAVATSHDAAVLTAADVVLPASDGLRRLRLHLDSAR